MISARLEQLLPEALVRRVRPAAGPLTLEYRRIFILPTRAGGLLAIVLGGMLVGAMNYSNSLAYALTFLLASMAVVSMLHTYRNLLGIGIASGRCPPVFAGEAAAFVLAVAGGERERPGINLQAGCASVALDLSAGTGMPVTLRRTATRRGRLALGRVRIETRYPLGIFRAWAYAEPGMSCIVFPRPADTTEPPPVGSGRAGAGRSRDARGSDDFSSLRGYRAGDSLRHVHWKVYARRGALVTKQFTGEEPADLRLDWEALPGLDTEARLSVLCRWVLEAEDGGRRYALVLPGVEVPTGRGEMHRYRCLETLALYPGRQGDAA